MKEAFHDLLVYGLNHPLALAFAEATRSIGDVVDVPGVGRVVNRPEIAREILLDGLNFNKTGPGSFGAMVTQVMGESALLNMDGEAHLALRSKLQDLFSPAYLRVIEQEVVRQPVNALQCALQDGRKTDIVRFVQLLTGRTIRHMLGLPLRDGLAAEDECLDMFRFSRRLTDSIGLRTKVLSSSQVEAKRVPFEQLTAAVIDAYGRVDFPERSVLGRLKELGLSAEEARGVFAAILIAGTETLTTAIPRMVALLIDSGQQRLLRREPSLLQGAIDESLRFVVPLPIIIRSVRVDMTVANVRFKAGQRVMVFTYNLFKHRALYPSPRRFDIRREQPAVSRNLWFGAGPHFCIGFALAQREMRAVLDLLIRLPGELRVRHRSYARGVLIPGYSRLDVEMVH